MMYLIFVIAGTVSHTVISQNGQYQLDAVLRGGTVFEAREFTLSGGGTMLYHVDDPGVHSFFVSDHGTVFALSEHHAVFFDRRGECDTLMHCAFLNNAGFSDQGDLFYLSMRDGIYVYDIGGDRKYTLAPGRLFASTSHGTKIAVVSADTLRLYQDGVHIHTKILRTAYVHNVRFAGPGYLRVEEHDGVELFDTGSGERIE